jgi:GT2 family glycosyltransferase
VGGAIPTYVVVPVKDRLELTRALIAQLEAQGGYEAVFVLDNGSTDGTRDWLGARRRTPGVELVDAAGLRIYAMWNLGVRLARSRHPTCNVAILNNDLALGPGVLVRLATALHSRPDLWVVSPNYDCRPLTGVQYVRSTYKGQGLAGFAFMGRGEILDRFPFDEGFNWWYGEDDFLARVDAAGGRVGIVGEANVEHIGGGSQTVRYTPDILAAIERDRRRMWSKWGHF